MSGKKRSGKRQDTGGLPFIDASSGDVPFADEPTTPRDAVPLPGPTPGRPAWGRGAAVANDDDARAQIDTILDAARMMDDPAPLLAMLAEKAPVALAEVCCGSRAPGGVAFVRASLAHVDLLEGQVTPRGLYVRLLELCRDDVEARLAVLGVAAERFPAASWVVKLSRKVEGNRAGCVHLVAAVSHPSFAQVCTAHAEVGHVEGLLHAAAATGRGEPAAALLAVDPAFAARAAALALSHSPSSSVVAHLAAGWGAEPDAIVSRIVPQLRTRAAAEALLAWSRHLPHTARILRAVIPGMAR